MLSSSIEKLTPEQEKLVPIVRDEWINLTLRSGKYVTEEQIREDIDWLYSVVDKKGLRLSPHPKIFIFDSYTAMQLGFNLIKNMKIIDRLERVTMERLWDKIWYGEGGKPMTDLLNNMVFKSVQDSVWNSLSRPIDECTCQNTWDTIRLHNEGSLKNVLWRKVHFFTVGDTVLGNFRIDSKDVWNQIIDGIFSIVEEQVGQRIRRNIENTTKYFIINSYKENNNNDDKLFLEHADHCIGLGNWAGWIAFFDFFIRAGILKEVPEEFIRFRRLMSAGIWTACFFEECVLVCRLPEKIVLEEEDPTRNDTGSFFVPRLHCTTGPAVKWLDGTGQYYLFGVTFNDRNFEEGMGITIPELWEKIVTGNIKFKEILGIRNIEQRYVALRMYGPERLLKEMKAKRIDKSKRGNELYFIKGFTFDHDGTKRMGERTTDTTVTTLPDMKLLKYKDPSTGRVYVSFVPENIKKADEGLAWKFYLTTEEYSLLKHES